VARLIETLLGPEAQLTCRMITVPLSEAKDQLSALVEAAETTHDIVTITRHGRAVAVLMAKSDLDSLHETLFWLSQPGVRDDVAAAQRELAEARTVPAADLRAEYGASATGPAAARGGGGRRM
jgi:antitoxin YefM